MGKVGKNKSVISTSVDDTLAAEIEQRAAALGKTKGAYLRDLIVQWYDDGARPVGKLDELMQADRAVQSVMLSASNLERGERGASNTHQGSKPPRKESHKRA